MAHDQVAVDGGDYDGPRPLRLRHRRRVSISTTTTETWSATLTTSSGAFTGVDANRRQ
jgi:hypothetical protein